LKINIDESLRRRLRDLDKQSRRRVGVALDQLAAAWGNPHLHAGAGIRKLPDGYFECRSGLKLRLLFKVQADALHIVLMGNHDEVRRFIKSSR